MKILTIAFSLPMLITAARAADFNHQFLRALRDHSHTVVIKSKYLGRMLLITKDGISEKNRLFETKLVQWREIQEINGRDDHVSLTLSRPWLFGLIPIQHFSISCANLNMNADEVVEIIRLAYNDWKRSPREQ